ncbi:TPA_asm: hypothetical protein G4G51_004579 [Salmonella enterica subsp. enterica serovar Dublin]|uniref:Uncharacterized protein n=1 Tax=Salmonella dublin TaxID=98360 RepID=A0A732D319_SALDU|nr:hypothetical protein [Salmonella enterica]EDU1385365.1 hypothetical protein [Salmonella enterica subsp. enterica serovar 4,[5],12:b:-]EKR1395903.1 hypothetical protein [Salmonella enterica subsp. enterica serovar Dublin]EBQ1580892.1 hypothetical protein [Salmonella enterica]EKR1404957.1 hypothetical protein [Salmonella enterica subsp. enterica serovar Dublin]
MSADDDKSECGQFSSPASIQGMLLADFARRVRACKTYRRLDMLHTLLLRTVPVSKRADYIALLNQRDEELSFEETDMEWRI